MEHRKYNTLVSIIIPVYNTEVYLPRCLDSIQAQSYKNLEILMIDDGSKDHSNEICHRYEEKDHRFHLIRQNNQGVSMARNHGLELAHGQYVLFVDSDDEVTEDYVKTLVEQAKEKTLVIGRFWHVDEESNDLQADSFYLKKGIYTKKEFLRTIVLSPFAHYIGVLWNKIYELERIRDLGIRFDPAITLGEDFVFNMQYMQGIDQIACVDEQIYRYRWRRPDSLCAQEKPEEVYLRERLVMFDAYQALYAHEGLDKSGKWNWFMNYYLIKLYFDELEKNKAEDLLYHKLIADTGMNLVQFRVFWCLKQTMKMGKKLLKKLLMKS